MSRRDIHAIIKEEEARRLQHKHQQQQQEISSKAYELFSKGKKPVEVAITLNLREPSRNKILQRILETKAITYAEFII
jgi:hypothetical protein